MTQPADSNPISAVPSGDPGTLPARPLLVRCGNWFFRYRDAVFPLVFVLLAVLLRPGFPFGSRALDYVVDVVGLATAAAGQLLRVAVIGLAYIRRGGKDKRIYASALVQEGFFAHSRNPLYLGNGLVLLGLLLIHGSPFFLLAGGGFYLFAYLSITAAEEKFLHQTFGAEYLEYMRRVPRYVPRLQGLGNTLKGMAFDWRRVVRKEYNSTFTWLTCVMALFVWEEYRNVGPDAAREKLGFVLPLFALLVLAYAVVRVLKKTKRLGTT